MPLRDRHFHLPVTRRSRLVSRNNSTQSSTRHSYISDRPVKFDLLIWISWGTNIIHSGFNQADSIGLLTLGRAKVFSLRSFSLMFLRISWECCEWLICLFFFLLFLSLYNCSMFVLWLRKWRTKLYIYTNSNDFEAVENHIQESGRIASHDCLHYAAWWTWAPLSDGRFVQHWQTWWRE